MAVGNFPEIHISPNPALVDSPIKLQVKGLEPDQLVTLCASLDSMPGMKFKAHSYAEFRADSNGSIDLTRDAALSGTYTGIDPMGLFWSMELSDLQYQMTRNLDELEFYPRQSVIHIAAKIDDQIVAESELVRMYIEKAVQIETIWEQGFVGKFFHKANADPSTGVIVLGGAEGGLGPQLQFAALFASHGYPCLALPYFRFDNLPEDLKEIPLEYFLPALEWMRNNSKIKSDQIAVFGRSKGAELALLLGSKYQEIKAVIASSPSSCACIAHFTKRDGTIQTYSPWSVDGKPLPYIKWSDKQCREAEDRVRRGERIDHIHLEGLMDKTMAEQAEISVEKINGPILLISSDDDHWWPATLHSEKIMQRLSKHEFPFRYKHLSYRNTGHLIRFPYIPTTNLRMNGGTAKNNAEASADSWEQVLNFLKDAFN